MIKRNAFEMLSFVIHISQSSGKLCGWMPTRQAYWPTKLLGFEILDNSCSDSIKVFTCLLSVEAPFRVSNATTVFPLDSLYSQLSICHFIFLSR